MILKFIEGWGRFVTGARVVLAAIFLPIMVFGFILFPETRIVSGVAVIILSFVIALYFRSRKEVRSSLVVGDMAVKEALSPWCPAVSGFTNLKTVNLTIIVTQLVGAYLAWRMLPSGKLMAPLFGAGSASIIGLGVGILVDYAHSRSWRHATVFVRRFYIFSAAAFTSISLLLLLVLYSSSA